MPVTITPVAPGNLVGPGLQISLSSDFIGPLPTGSFWRLIYSTDAEGANRLYSNTIDTDSPSYTGIPLTLPYPSHVSLTNWLKDGDTVYVTGELNDDTGPIDSGTQAETWSNTAGIYNLLGSFQASTTAGAFTAADRSTIQTTQAGINLRIPAVGAAGGFVLRTLGELLGNGVPPQFTNRHSSILVSGSGAISRGTEPFRVDSLGFEWHWNTIPEVWGELIGDPDEIERRVVQWRVIDEDDSGQLFQRDVIDSSFDGVRYLWGAHVPITLEWFVTPGAVVELSFLVFALG